jgi:hypothetical protein
MVLLFLFQLLVTSFVQDQAGADARGTLHPRAIASFFMKTDWENIDKCSSVPFPLNATIDPNPANANFFFSPAPDSTASDPMGQYVYANTSLNTGFYAALNPGPYPVLHAVSWPERGFFQQVCYNTPTIVPRLNVLELESAQSLDNKLYSGYGTNDDPLGAVQMKRLKFADREIVYNVLYNYTLTLGDDLPLLMTTMLQATLNYFTGGETTGRLSAVRNFPVPDEKPDFDIVSLAGSFLYIYMLQVRRCHCFLACLSYPPPPLSQPHLQSVTGQRLWLLAAFAPGRHQFRGVREGVPPARDHENDGTPHVSILDCDVHICSRPLHCRNGCDVGGCRDVRVPLLDG